MNEKIGFLIYEYLKNLNPEKIETNTDFDVFKLEDPISFLFWCIERGYLLHGSPILLDRLEPRQARGLLNQGGSQNAVYMSKNPYACMAKSLIGNRSGGYEFILDENNKLIPKSLYIDDLNKLGSEGYIYVIDPDNNKVTEAEKDYVSADETIPSLAIKFSIEDFPFQFEEKK